MTWSVMALDAELHAEWLKNRKLTTIAFAIQNAFLGCEYGIFITNLWLYIIEIVKPNTPRLYYSLISMSYLLSTVVFSIFVSKFADKTRNTRKVIFFSNAALIVGNIIYMLPFSPWILVVARIIGGAGQPQRSVISGELARSYSHHEITSIFAIMGTASAFGFMAAPGVNILFSSLDIWLGAWHINFTNIPGFYMATFFVISQFMTYFMVSDLSKEYDFKGEIENTNKLDARESYSNVDATEKTFLLSTESTEEINAVIDGGNNQRSLITSYGSEAICSHSGVEQIIVKSLLKKLLTHYDTALILGLSFWETFFIISFDMCLPILIIGRLEWSTIAFNSIMLVSAACAIVPTIVLTFKTISDRKIFYFAVVSIFTYGILQTIQMLWAIKISNITFNICLSAIYCLLFAGVMIMKNVFLSGFLAKMVSSRYQALTDGIRVAISRVLVSS